MHHQCIVLSISELQRIDDLCINAVIYAGLESSCSRFGDSHFARSSQFRWGRDSLGHLYSYQDGKNLGMLGIMLTFAALTRITLCMNNTQANLYNPFYGEELYTLYKERFGHTPMFTEPGQLREVFDNYVMWCRNHPIESVDYVKSGVLAGQSYVVRKKLLVTEFGFTQFLGTSCDYLNTREKGYKEQHEKYHDDESLAFLEEIRVIRQWIRDDMDKGASVGLYDPNYISKLRGLKALSDVTSNDEKITGGLRVEVLSNDTAKRMQALAKVAKKREKHGDDKLDDPKE